MPETTREKLRTYGLRLATAIPRVARNPAVAADLADKALASLSSARHRTRVAHYGQVAIDVDRAFSRVTNESSVSVAATVDRPGFRTVMTELDAYRPTGNAPAMGGAAFLELCYAVVAAARPSVVVETGVAHGFSTAVILQALEDAGSGRLHSVDLPVFRPGVADLTGDAIPARLTSTGRWELSAGSDRRMLPSLLARIGPIDLAFYDSEKRYPGMLRSWYLLWSHLRPGGVLVMDDIEENDAYLEFMERVGQPPTVVRKPAERELGPWVRDRYVGLARKVSPIAS